MKIALERVDARGIDLDAGGLSLRVADAANLRGHVAGSDVTAQADALMLAAFSVALGDLLLQSATGLRLEGLSIATRSEPHLAIEASASVATTDELIVTIDDIVVRGKARLEGVRLEVRGDEGSLAAERVVLDGFALTIGTLALTTPRVAGAAVHISWGKAFRLNARELAAPELEVAQPGLAVRATNVAVTDLAVLDGISIDRITVERAEVELALGASSEPAGARSPGAPFVFDWGILDFLSGQIDVDVHVDIAVPVIGRRKATHRLRVPIDSGIIDYRELERNLANLENALLDFAVRDEGLALERVNPLFPMRGHGKPIVVWPLGPEDRALAERDHVRLALLSSYELAAPASTPDEPPAISLKKLDLLGLAADLTLAPVEIPLGGPLRPRQVERLELRGELHDRGPGSLAADVSGLALSVRDLGGLSIDLASAVTIRPLSIAFADLRPTEIRLVVEKVALDTLAKGGAVSKRT